MSKDRKTNMQVYFEAHTLLVFVKEQEKKKEKRGPSFLVSSLFTQPQIGGDTSLR